MKLPEGVQGVPSLGHGPNVAVQLDNRSGEEVVLSPEWTIGQVSQVQLVAKPPPEEGPNLPEVPKTLTTRQRRQLRALLDHYADVFSKKGAPISSTPYIAHEIHTTGPPIRQPSRRQNPLVSRAGAAAGTGNAAGWGNSAIYKSMGLPCGNGKKERQQYEVLRRLSESQ